MILLAGVSLLLSGCVDLVQEITVRGDGSGSLRFALGVDQEAFPVVMERIPEGLLLENVLSALIQDENIVDVNQENYEDGGQSWDVLTLEVENFSALLAEVRRIGPLMMSLKSDEANYTFEQVIDLKNSPLSIPGINLMDLTSAGYTVRLVVPQIVDTNGLQTEAGVSVWKVPLRNLLQDGERIVLQADYVLEPFEGTFIPWETFFPYVVGGFLAAGVIVILAVVIVNTTRKGEKPEKIRY